MTIVTYKPLMCSYATRLNARQSLADHAARIAEAGISLDISVCLSGIRLVLWRISRLGGTGCNRVRVGVEGRHGEE